jgi:hypothetical protein
MLPTPDLGGGPRKWGVIRGKEGPSALVLPAEHSAGARASTPILGLQ